GAHSFPERYPRTFAVGLPGVAVSVRTPLADGNIAVFANRWKLIDDDTLPTYLAFVRDHGDEARAVVATPYLSAWPNTGCSPVRGASPRQHSRVGTWTSLPRPRSETHSPTDARRRCWRPRPTARRSI